MLEPIPGNPDQRPDVSWFAPQVVQLEHAASSGSDSTEFSNNLLRLIFDRPNQRSNEETLTEDVRAVMLMSAAIDVSSSLSDKAKEAFAKDIHREWSSLGEQQIPKYAEWLKALSSGGRGAVARSHTVAIWQGICRLARVRRFRGTY